MQWGDDVPKMKTNRAARKRFKVTKSGKIKHFHSGKRHILTKMSTKRKRNLRGSDYLSSGDAGLVRRLLPNG